jgi:CSLREA domain-containing protein
MYNLSGRDTRIEAPACLKDCKSKGTPMVNIRRQWLQSTRGTLAVDVARFVAVGMLVLLVSGVEAWAATLTVTTTADGLTPNDGSVSLREAITAINAGNNLGDPDIIAQNPGTFGPLDMINFKIPGTGVHVIRVGTGSAFGSGIPLPKIMKPVVINGYSQPGSHVNTLAHHNNAVLLVELNGASAGKGADGVVLDGGASRVLGVVINNFSGNGIVLGSGGNVIAGNFIGTDSSGTNPGPGNANDGVLINQGARAGPCGPVAGNLVMGNVIGGNDAAAGNIISFNRVNGIEIVVQPNLIAGNLISGNGANNGDDGIEITGTIVERK